MVDDLTPVIEAIGALSDSTESGRWEIAEAIHDAFAEFPAYTQGLLQGLCNRLKYTSTNIYNYKNAWEVRSEYLGETKLSVSHFSKLHTLRNKYKLTEHDVLTYIDLAETGDWSALKLEQEVSGNHEPDPDEAYKRKFQRFVKLMRSIWNDPQFGNVDKDTRAVYYDLLGELEKI